ncbi:MAG: ornithine carbamoyltransferase [Chloroflexi bacterium]|nr:ornithine carbamoyltransferase [Chloroflexota bacterium]
MTSHFLSMNDLSDAELRGVLDAADAFRGADAGGAKPLAGKTVAMLFEKPSLRTKVSFDVAVYELGGHSVFLSQEEVGLDAREPAEDVARVLSRWVAIIVARVLDHRTLERLAAASSVPVVNGLSDVEHPAQALADLLTVRQHHGRLDGVRVAYVGDANNCALSLALGCAATGASFAIASPEGYGFDPARVKAIEARGTSVRTTAEPREAVEGADVVYTDVWTSMGQEAETKARREAFDGFTVDEALLARANPGAILMHPMPAHYGDEVPAGMLDHPQSAAFDQAENRLHAQKALLRLLAGGA